jgi:hypothetical protein
MTNIMVLNRCNLGDGSALQDRRRGRRPPPLGGLSGCDRRSPRWGAAPVPHLTVANVADIRGVLTTEPERCAFQRTDR